MATATPVLPKLVGERVKRREDPRLIQGRGTYVDDIKITGMLHLAFKRCDIAHGKITTHRHQRRREDGRRRSGLHRRRHREGPRADADRHAVSVAAASCGRRRRGALCRRAGCRRRRIRSLPRARCRRCDRRVVRSAAGRRRSRSGHGRQARRHPQGLSEQPRRRAGAERHRRRAGLFEDRQHRGRQGVCRRRSRRSASAWSTIASCRTRWSRAACWRTGSRARTR